MDVSESSTLCMVAYSASVLLFEHAYQSQDHLVIGVIAKLPGAMHSLTQVFLFHLRSDFFFPPHFPEHIPKMKPFLTYTEIFLYIS